MKQVNKKAWAINIGLITAAISISAYFTNIVRDNSELKDSNKETKVILKDLSVKVDNVARAVDSIKVIVDNNREVTAQLVQASQQSTREIKTQIQKLYSPRFSSFYTLGYQDTATKIPFYLTSNANLSTTYRSN